MNITYRGCPGPKFLKTFILRLRLTQNIHPVGQLFDRVFNSLGPRPVGASLVAMPIFRLKKHLYYLERFSIKNWYFEGNFGQISIFFHETKFIRQVPPNYAYSAIFNYLKCGFNGQNVSKKHKNGQIPKWAFWKIGVYTFKIITQQVF